MKQIMFELLVTGVDMLAAGIFAVPGILLLVLLFGRIRRERMGPLTLGLLVIFELYLCAMFSVVGLPALAYIRFEPEFNLLPLVGMVENRTALLLTGLNVALFVPLGFFIPLLWPKYAKKTWQVAGVGFGVSLLVEFIQIFSFRLTDVDDLIANTAGALLGFGLFKLLPERRRGKLAGQPVPLWAAVLLGVAVVMFLSPLIYSRFWDLLMGK